MTDVPVVGIQLFGQTLDLFWVGVLGSVGVELAVFASHYDNVGHPEKYRKLGFYITKVLLALIGGFLVKIYGVTAAPAALQIGASGSAIVLALSRKDNAPA